MQNFESGTRTDRRRKKKQSRGADRACPSGELSQALSCDDGLGQLVQLLADVDGLLNDFNRAVSEYLSDLEFDEEQLSETENRLNTVNHLKDKYGSTIEEVLAYAEQKNQELDRLLHQEEWLEQKRRELSENEKMLAQLARNLTALRTKAAQGFQEKDMEAHCRI